MKFCQSSLRQPLSGNNKIALLHRIKTFENYQTNIDVEENVGRLSILECL